MYRFQNILIAGLALTASTALADTLSLEDGNVLKGTYVGGSPTQLKFDVSGQVLTFKREQVRSLTFEAPPPPAPKPSVPAAAPVSGATAPAGSLLQIKLTQGLSSKRAAAGMTFRGALETGLQVDGAVILPAGTKVYGKTTTVQSGGRLRRRAQLGLTLTAVLAGEIRVPVVTNAAVFTGAKQGTAGKVVAGAAIGLAFGGRAARGAAVGGTMAALSPGKQVNIPPGTILEFKLAEPIQLP